MDKAVLRNFAIESRKDLMEKIDRKIKLFYIDEEFKKDNRGDVIVLSNDKHTLTLTKEDDLNRDKLIKRIVEYGYEQVVEEAAYTWFNRIIAIRYMEIHDFLPLTTDNQSIGIRVLSSVDNKPEPEILKFSNISRSDLNLEIDLNYYTQIKKDDDKFKYILLKVCNKIGKVIPQVFDGITDYIDLLLPDSLLSENGFVNKLLKVDENNFKEVEIIGWLYQYYNSAEKDKAMESKKAYKKNEIPYVTQLFTPDWIVKYMVENSLGRFWIENNGLDSSLKNDMSFFVDGNLKEKSKHYNPEEIKFIDPCCGSGHILVYAFEIFYKIYEKAGYNSSEIAEKILTNNIYGLDIDARASQLSILSVLLKAREYDKKLFNKPICNNLNIFEICEPLNIDSYSIDNLENDQYRKQVLYLIEKFKNAKEEGSLIKLEYNDYSGLRETLYDENSIFTLLLREKIIPIIKVAEILQDKYQIVVTNPPYMGNSYLSEKMKKFLLENYKEGKNDLCTAFMQIDLVEKNGYYGIINQQVWMFTVLYENLRSWMLNNRSIVNMIHLGTRAFEEISGEVVSTTSFVMSGKSDNETTGYFYRLVDVKDANEKMNIFKFKRDKIKYELNMEKFNLIQGNPFAYWLNEKIFNSFEKIAPLSENFECKVGLGTGDNEAFLRYWFEVSNEKVNKKWFPYNKAGGFRKWYGNQMYYLDWEDDGDRVKKCKNSYVRNPEYYFKESVSWCDISTGLLSARYYPSGFGFDSCSPSVFPLKNNSLKYILAFMNSKVAQMYMDILSPTIHYNTGSMSKVPLLITEDNEIIELVDKCIELAKDDWDSYETSWEYLKHPLLKYKTDNIENGNYRIEDLFLEWEKNCKSRFDSLKQCEENINKKFIELYDLKTDLNFEVEDKDISVRLADRETEIKSLISYSVGCMFGRYSLDQDGLVFADSCFEKSKYNKYIPDEDNIIPISDNEDVYYNDDIVARFKDFIKIAFGSKTLNQNLDYIAESLGKKGTESSDDTIRRYFLNDFYNDHIKTYQKRPIYWLFDSGRKNGFKCLVYLHRYDEQIVSKIRTKYLHNTLSIYLRTVEEIDYKLNNEELSTTDKRELQNKKVDLNGKITECNEYEEMVGNVANKMIKLDLDDGVVNNYAKFVDDNGKSILAKIK